MRVSVPCHRAIAANAAAPDCAPVTGKVSRFSVWKAVAQQLLELPHHDLDGGV